VLLLVAQDERAERFVQVEQPAGDDDPRMPRADGGWPERRRHEHRHAIQRAVLRVPPRMRERAQRPQQSQQQEQRRCHPDRRQHGVAGYVSTHPARERVRDDLQRRQRDCVRASMAPNAHGGPGRDGGAGAEDHGRQHP